MQSGDWEGWAPTAFLPPPRGGGGRLASLAVGGWPGGGGARRAFGGRPSTPPPAPRLHPEPANRPRVGAAERLDPLGRGLLASWPPPPPSTWRPDPPAPGEAVAAPNLGGDREHLPGRGHRRERDDPDAAGGGPRRGGTSMSTKHGVDVNPRLRELPNVVLLPHMGSATEEARVEMGEKVLINIKTFDDGHRPPRPRGAVDALRGDVRGAVCPSPPGARPMAQPGGEPPRVFAGR